MRKAIRKIIKESLYDNMERNLTLPSGKVLPNFRGVLSMLISQNIDFANQAITAIKEIEPYEIYKCPYNRLETEANNFDSWYMVSMFFNDKEVSDAFEKAILNHPEYNSSSYLYSVNGIIGNGFLDSCKTNSSGAGPNPWYGVRWNVDKK